MVHYAVVLEGKVIGSRSSKSHAQRPNTCDCGGVFPTRTSGLPEGATACLSADDHARNLAAMPAWERKMLEVTKGGR